MKKLFLISSSIVLISIVFKITFYLLALKNRSEDYSNNIYDYIQDGVYWIAVLGLILSVSQEKGSYIIRGLALASIGVLIVFSVVPTAIYYTKNFGDIFTVLKASKEGKDLNFPYLYIENLSNYFFVPILIILNVIILFFLKKYYIIKFFIFCLLTYILTYTIVFWYSTLFNHFFITSFERHTNQ